MVLIKIAQDLPIFGGNPYGFLSELLHTAEVTTPNFSFIILYMSLQNKKHFTNLVLTARDNLCNTAHHWKYSKYHFHIQYNVKSFVVLIATKVI